MGGTLEAACYQGLQHVQRGVTRLLRGLSGAAVWGEMEGNGSVALEKADLVGSPEGSRVERGERWCRWPDCVRGGGVQLCRGQLSHPLCVPRGWVGTPCDGRDAVCPVVAVQGCVCEVGSEPSPRLVQLCDLGSCLTSLDLSVLIGRWGIWSPLRAAAGKIGELVLGSAFTSARPVVSSVTTFRKWRLAMF